MNEPGMCECGCGERTALAARTFRRKGYVRGKPRRYVRGHNGRITLATKLATRVEQGPDCWLWQGALSKCGYGTIRHLGSLLYAHRVAWEQAYGPIPDGLHIDHLCRNRACCRPDHLEPVTQAVNNQRAAAARKVGK